MYCCTYYSKLCKTEIVLESTKRNSNNSKFQILPHRDACWDFSSLLRMNRQNEYWAENNRNYSFCRLILSKVVERHNLFSELQKSFLRKGNFNRFEMKAICLITIILCTFNCLSTHAFNHTVPSIVYGMITRKTNPQVELEKFSNRLNKISK
jgi:hypothetical protein